MALPGPIHDRSGAGASLISAPPSPRTPLRSSTPEGASADRIPTQDRHENVSHAVAFQGLLAVADLLGTTPFASSPSFAS
jgi:hypothetical protein